MIKHCVSLEIAKELKLAGWKKETEFWWAKDEKGIVSSKDRPWMLTYTNKEHQADFVTYFPAPLATEILEDIDNEQIVKYVYKFCPMTKVWLVFLSDILKDVNEIAKMCLYLKKEGEGNETYSC